MLFTKFASSLIGPYATIVAPPESQQIDFEAEIAVVIGTAGRRIQAATALDHVAGYAIVNDVSMRDLSTGRTSGSRARRGRRRRRSAPRS